MYIFRARLVGIPVGRGPFSRRGSLGAFTQRSQGSPVVLLPVGIGPFSGEAVRLDDPRCDAGVAESIAVIEWIGSFTIFVTLDSFDNA